MFNSRQLKHFIEGEDIQNLCLFALICDNTL